MKINVKDLVALHNKPRVVFDVGGFHGNYTAAILERFDCEVVIFEPVREFSQICSKRFLGDERVIVTRFALGDGRGETTIYKNKIGSTQFKELTKSVITETAPLDKLSRFITNKVDLIKLNCEGAEYDILQDLLATGWLHKIPELLVQFHKIGGFMNKRSFFINEMAKTHKVVYDYKWFLWQLK